MGRANVQFSHNPRQAAVVNECGQCCLVTAIPGSGKTKTVIDKIVHLLRGHERGLWHAPKRVIAVTFTKEAGKELTQRTAAAVGEKALERLQTGTFHALLLAALKRVGSEVAHRDVAKGGQMEQYRDRALNAKSPTFRRAKSLDDKAYYRSLFERARCVLEDPYGLEEAQDEGLNESFANELREAVEHYKKLMKQHRLLDFSMIMEEALAYLRSADGQDIERTKQYAAQREKQLADGTAMTHSEELTEQFLKADHCIVDESQDVDQYQLAIILEIADRGVIVDMVGDDDQSIYKFRHGLGYEGMESFLERTGARHLVLDINYRCRNEILQLAGQVIRQNKKRHDKDLIGTRDYGGIVTLDTEDHGAGEIRRVQDNIVGLLNAEKNGAPVRTKAIIARLNKVLDEFQVALSKANIKVERVGGKSLWDETPVWIMVALIEGMIKNEKSGIDQALHFAGVNTDHVDMDNLELVAAGQKDERSRLAVATMADMWRTCRTRVHSAFQEHVTDVVAEVYRWFLGVIEHGSFSKGQTEFFIGKLRMAARVLGGDQAARRAESGRDVSDWAPRDGDRGTGLEGNLARRLKTVATLDRSGKADEGAVKIVSMHGAKGREWDVVYLVGCEDSVIPGNCADDDDETLEEERRLLYVAITRAKDELHISWSRNQLNTKKKVEERECRFLADLTMRPSESLTSVHDEKWGTTV